LSLPFCYVDAGAGGSHGGLAAGCGERDLTVEHVERLVLAMAERRLAARVMASISDLAEESRAKTSSA
jgi:hypothetical protein